MGAVFVDTHCHLDFKAYRHDLEKVIHNALEKGVYRIVVPGLDLTSSYQAVQLADRFESVYAAVGVHPCEVDSFTEKDIFDLTDLTRQPKVVAIGEIGLDFFHRSDNKAKQGELLQAMLSIAIEADLPIILHSREALNELIAIIKDLTTTHSSFQKGGVFHAFEGTISDASKVTEMGFKIGAGGPVTYKNAHIKHELLSKINLSHVVLETDSPFLAPQQHRGSRNEPGFIPMIADKIAQFQHCTVENVADITTRNAQILFNWIN